MSEFKVGDKVVCIDDDLSRLNKGEIYTIDRIIDNTFIHVKDSKGEISGGWIVERFQLYKPSFTQESFSGLNYQDAKKYIGKMMEFSDNCIDWKKYILIALQPDWDCKFETPYNCFAYTRTIPETFKSDEKAILPVLKKTILQWKMMKETGKDKEECYKFLGGTIENKNNLNCFLCDFTGYSSPPINSSNVRLKCKNCIAWPEGKECFSAKEGIFRKWQGNITNPTRIQSMIDHFKSELSRIENS